MTQICVSLTEETTVGVIDRMVDLDGAADLFEVRGDLVLDLDLLTILRARNRPLVFTCRPESQGGRWNDSDTRRRLLLLEAVKRGYDYVDVELGCGFLDVIGEKAGRGLIVSHHDLEGTPEDLDGLYRDMCRVGADVVKLAVTPQSVADLGRLLDLAGRVAASGERPLVPIALGPMGIASRILAGRHGAPFTYASAAPGAEAGAGQLPVAAMADLYHVRSIGPGTRVYGVVGSDVTRSLSPILHNRAFEAAGLDAIYVPLQAEALPPFIRALPALDLAGFSVTRPYKVDILAHVQELDEAAALCGSVNTVVCHDGVLQGSTTDGVGVLAALKRRLDVKGRSVVILGAGGGARAAALALTRKGARVTVLARDADRAAFVAAAVDCQAGSLEDLAAYPWEVLVNGTPLGSGDTFGETPVPAHLHRPGSLVFDMVYDPLETRLLREAQAAGCVIVDGLEMLLHQAAAQFETWTGMEAPLDVMKSAALLAVQERET
jgi:3-dehydroquinate dehydratase/shikimate dehydrogenase